MIPQTQNPVIPLIEVEGRLADGRFVVRYQGQKVAATEAQLLAIHRELGIPVTMMGVGEGVDDLQPFDAKGFAEAIFSPDSGSGG